QRYMQQHFRKEIGEERERLEKYKKFVIPSDNELPTQTHNAPAEVYRASAQSVTGTMLPGMLNPPPPSASISTAELLARGQDSEYQHQPARVIGAISVDGRVSAPPRPSEQDSADRVPSIERSVLPTWAAALIGALTVLLLGALALLAYQLLWKEPPSGVLVIQSTPQSIQLSINGTQVADRTPFTLEGLRPDTYVLRARADGYDEVVRAVRVESGQRHLESIELARRPGSASVIVRTNPPGLHVWINGRNTGLVTPATVTGLYAGEQNIWLRRDDGSLVHRFRMTLTESSAEVVEVDTRRLPALLDVTSVPAAARVEILGQQKGTTPTTIAGLKPGRVSVRVSKDGCQPIDREVRLAPATVTMVDVKLDCSGRPPVRLSTGTAKATFTASMVADIYVDGERIGQTPFFNYTLSAGEHSLRLVPVSGDRPAYDAAFKVTAGKPQTVHHDF
ncbi:MAG: PEGA domain-containing protein, partial [Myxococcota bacterium]